MQITYMLYPSVFGRYIIVSIVCFCMLTQMGCTKRVFRYSDTVGTSSINLYRSGNYLYKEKTTYGEFKVWGKYVLTDQWVRLDYDTKYQLPFTYISLLPLPSPFSVDSNFFRLQIVGDISNEGMILLHVELLDNAGNRLFYTPTDFEGWVTLPKQSKATTLKISMLGMPTLITAYPEVKHQCLQLKLPETSPTSALKGDCLVWPYEVGLYYQLNRPKKFTTLQCGNYVYQLKGRQ